MTDLDPVAVEAAAKAAHDAYEAAAPDHGYETRPESRKAWEDLPANHRALMNVSIAAAIASYLDALPKPDDIAPGQVWEWMPGDRVTIHAVDRVQGAVIFAEPNSRGARRADIGLFTNGTYRLVNNRDPEGIASEGGSANPRNPVADAPSGSCPHGCVDGVISSDEGTSSYCPLHGPVDWQGLATELAEALVELSQKLETPNIRTLTIVEARATIWAALSRYHQAPQSEEI